MFVLVGGSPDSGDHRQLCRWELGEARSSGNQGLCEGKEKKRQQFDLDTPFSSIRDCVQGSVANSECLPS